MESKGISSGSRKILSHNRKTAVSKSKYCKKRRNKTISSKKRWANGTEKQKAESRKIESSKKEEVAESRKSESRTSEARKETGLGKQELGKKDEQKLATEKQQLESKGTSASKREDTKSVTSNLKDKTTSTSKQE